MADDEIRTAAERLIAWARTGRLHPCADPLDRLVLIEDHPCRLDLQTLLGRARSGQRTLVRPLDLPPRLLPPP